MKYNDLEALNQNAGYVWWKSVNQIILIFVAIKKNLNTFLNA